MSGEPIATARSYCRICAALVAQLAALRPPAPLCLVPRRQKRHVNSQLTFLGDAPDPVTGMARYSGIPVSVHAAG